MIKTTFVAANLALAAVTPASAHGWGGHGGGFGFFPFFPFFVAPPPVYYYPPPYYAPPPVYQPPPVYRPRPPVYKDQAPITPPPNAHWDIRPEAKQPASATHVDEHTCAVLTNGDQKRVIKAINIDSHGQALIQFDDNSCYFSADDKQDEMIRTWTAGDEILILTEGKDDDMHHFQVINQSRGNIGLDPPEGN